MSRTAIPPFRPTPPRPPTRALLIAYVSARLPLLDDFRPHVWRTEDYRQVEAGSDGAPGTTERDLVLFEPALAYRSANGVVLSWWVGEGVESASDVSLDVLDATGEVVRTFEPAEEGEERVRWDLRTNPAATFPGMILWGVRTMAPVVPPGEYRVRLRVGRAVMSQRLVVKRNPWITDVTDEDLAAQYEFGVGVRDQVDRANRAVIEIRRVKGELAERLEGVEDDETLMAAAEWLRAALDEIEGEIYQVRNRSNQDPLNFPIKVNNRLANLLSMSERGDGRPGSGMYEVFEIMVGRLEGLLGGLEGVMREVEGFLGGVGGEVDGGSVGGVVVGDGEGVGEVGVGTVMEVEGFSEWSRESGRRPQRRRAMGERRPAGPQIVRAGIALGQLTDSSL